MLIICQFPLIDYRNFVEGDAGMVAGPVWPLPAEETEFVRYWGSIRRRLKGGLGAWIGEARHCIADGALRIPPTDEAKALFDGLGARLLFRTFYFDGTAVGKFEVGFNIGKKLSPDVSVVDAVHRVLALCVKAPDPRKEVASCTTLAKVGDLLADAYLVNTTLLKRLPLPAENDWWVERGSEMVLVELHENEERSVGVNALGEYPGVGDFPTVTHHILKEKGKQVRLWVYRRPKLEGSSNAVRSTCRSLRIALLRVHAEQTALRGVLRQIKKKNIPLESEKGDALLDYFNKASSRILKWERDASLPVIDIANTLDEQANPGERDLLLEEVNSIVPNIKRKVQETITGEKVQAPGKRTILFLAASPSGEAALQFAVEKRYIHDGLRLAKNRDLFSLQDQLATRIIDLRRAMLDHKPQIVHFTGHGDGDGILLQDDAGDAKVVNGEALRKFFGLFPKVECVVLNACYSEAQAVEIVQKVPYVIGMQNAASDTGAIKFSVAFYDAIGAGESYTQAFAFAENALEQEGLTQAVRPVLKVRDA